MTPALLARIGRAMYGDQWQTPLSRDLDVSDRTVRHWLSGRNAMPATLRADLLTLLDDREAALDELSRELMSG